MTAVLKITDGTTSVSLIKPRGQNGFHLAEWNPAVSGYKAGGTWQDSPLAEGRRLVDKRFENVIETFDIKLDGPNQNETIREGQVLRRLLEKASSYWTTDWQDEPVWIEAKATCESNTRYAIIYAGRIPQDDNPLAQPFVTSDGAVMDELTLVIERGAWTAYPSGITATVSQKTCIEAGGFQSEWTYYNLTLNTNLPVGDVYCFLVTQNGSLLAGETAEVWRTINGTAWNPSAVPPVGSVRSMIEASDEYIYAITTTGVYRSGDDGVNWAVRTNLVTTTSLDSITEHTDRYLYAVNAGDIVRSNDGFATFASVYVAGGGDSANSVRSANDKYLYAGTVATARMMRSLDGTTWDVILQFPFDGLGIQNSAANFEPSDGYLYAYANAGTSGSVYRTVNGVDWDILMPVAGIIPGGRGATCFVEASDGYYYGGNFGAPTILVSSGGTNWQRMDFVGPTRFWCITEFLGRIYLGDTGNVWWLSATVENVGQEASCADEVYVANNQNRAQLTNIWVYDASVPSYTAQFPAAAFPFQLLPNPMGNNDAVYFGIDSGVIDSGPFDNLIFNISTAASGTYTITWQYSNGAAGWPALNVNDNTIDFSIVGVNSVHWIPQAAWAPENVNGVVAYWVRALVGGVAGNPVGPAQGERDVYTVNWSNVSVNETQVSGDIPALLQINFRNRSDEDAYETIDELDTLENRVLVGLRSVSRGDAFIAYLNCSDEQNPVGIVADDGANTADANDITAPTGRIMVHTTTGLSTWTDECTFSIAALVARDFYGTFHAFLRAQQVDFSVEIGEVKLRLQVRTGTGGVSFTSPEVTPPNLNDWQLLDFGEIDIPASEFFSYSELGDETRLVIQIWSSVASLTVNLYDLILMPVDEWAIDAVDKALEDDSGVTNGYRLNIDSITHPKRDVRALVETVGVGLIRSVYQPITSSFAFLQANADQRLWFLTARAAVTGSHTGANNQTTLTDANASFLTSFVETGQVIFNITDGSVGTVGATVTATTITNCGLTGGTDNDWDTNDTYLIIAPNWRSEPWNCHSVQLWANPRYLSMRGDR